MKPISNFESPNRIWSRQSLRLSDPRILAAGAGIILLASLSLHAQQPYAYPSAPLYAQPQYSQPVQQYQNQYPQQQPYAQQGAAPVYQQQPQYAPQPDAGEANLYDPMGGADAQPAATPTEQPLNADQLEQLLAPVALYPDNLLAQILAAATYPAQLTAADQWLHQMQAQGYNDPNQIVAGADAQTGWDPSVKALTAFPQVLDMLNKNLEWTTNLGNAYYNQPQDVMQTVQVLRDRAQQAGTLESSPQEEVTEDQGNIDLAPATPDTVYVPAYNPWAAYGAPIAPYPGFSFSMLGMLGGFGAHYGYGGLQFGMGIAMAAFEHTPWGWLAWGLNWLGQSVLFNHSDYYTHSRTVADWGFPHGGPRAHGWGGAGWRGGPGHPEPYNRASGFENGRGPAYQRPGNTGPGNGFAGNNYGWNRGEPRPMTRPDMGMTHPALPAQQAYNRAPFTAPARPQSYAARPPVEARSYYGSGYGGGAYSHGSNAYDYSSRPAQNYAERPGMAYASPYRAPANQAPAYRAPQYGAPRAYASRPGESYGNAFAHNEKPGGFHLFGGRHESESYRAPKNFGGGHEPRSFGHEKAPKMPHGGGGHSGGGHSGGGHHRF
ncbi:MAG TPA: DUF3300 domain-containing protein [Terracidiphilus sp.]|nr:DUF3300 domain-containing protein [Terracidiphilus sp.]